MELRFAVVEDRLPDAQRLEGLLRLAFGNGYILVCDHFESGDAFLQAFPSRAYQAVFLDICMEGTNGIDTARTLRRTGPAAGLRDLIAGVCVGCISRPPLRLSAQALPGREDLSAGR